MAVFFVESKIIIGLTTNPWWWTTLEGVSANRDYYIVKTKFSIPRGATNYD
jgi:hypothetical protein